MLKQLFSLWKQDDLLAKSVDEFNLMLKSLNHMFTWTMDFVWQYQEGNSCKELYERDIEINQAERSIRKQIVEHLTFQPGQGVNQSLVLMSIVKDAERIGDYCKNIVEVAVHHKKHFNENEYVTELKDLQHSINEMFTSTINSFRDDNEAVATKIHEQQKKLGKACEDFILKIINSTDLNVPAAVSYVLIVRFYKRIIGHLGNIASSVSMPVHKLDYFDEKYANEPIKQQSDSN